MEAGVFGLAFTGLWLRALGLGVSGWGIQAGFGFMGGCLKVKVLGCFRVV